MYATDDEGNSASDIRHWMGDFSGINSVAKYIARMGQCFSKPEETINVSDEGVIVRNNKDFKKSDGYREYCFSDGIGKVSESLADRASELIIEPNDKHDKARDLHLPYIIVSFTLKDCFWSITKVFNIQYFLIAPEGIFLQLRFPPRDISLSFQDASCNSCYTQCL